MDLHELVEAMKDRSVESARRKSQDQIQAQASAGLPEHATGPQGAAARAIGHSRGKQFWCPSCGTGHRDPIIAAECERFRAWEDT